MMTVLEPTRRFLQVFCGKKLVMLDCDSPFQTDLTPVSFWIFPNSQHNWKGKRFQDVEEVKKNVTVTVTDTEGEFASCCSWSMHIAADVGCNQGQPVHLFLELLLMQQVAHK
jgi:hypothetical protein